MGFFKDFKDDVSQAVNELVDDATGLGAEPKDGKAGTPADSTMVNTIDTTTASQQTKPKTPTSAPTRPEPVRHESSVRETTSRTMAHEPAKQASRSVDSDSTVETAIITPGLKITGDIESSGAIELLGTVIGNVSCLGKLSVSGTIKGNTHSAAFYSNEAEITGNISCDGAAKIGNGSVVLGDLTATSAVIAGAIRGDIDVHGPVIIDTTAIVMGDIKSASVQINNGAAIEGHCSQCYSDNDPSKFFKDR